MRVLIIILGISFTVSCTNNETPQKRVLSSSLVPATTVSYTVSKSKIETSSKLEGEWETFNSGSKSKWRFTDNKLYKSSIYSFGEIGEPQVLDINYQTDCNGQTDIYGNSLSISISNKSTNITRTICYKILKSSKEEIILKSEHGQSFKLIRK